MPDSLGYLWEFFLDLNVTRDNYGWGPTKLKYREIAAWCDLTQQKLDPWELEALLRLDSAFLSVGHGSKESG